MPAALKPITGNLILLSHNFLNFCASLIFLVNFEGIAEIKLFPRNALTNLFEVFSRSVLSKYFLFFN